MPSSSAAASTASHYIPKHPQQLPIKQQIELCKVSTEKAKEILEELWFQYASRLVDKVSDICELDKDQRHVLKTLAMRPNDFLVEETK